MSYEYDNETEYLFDQEIDKMNKAEEGLKRITDIAKNALHLDTCKTTELDTIRQTALDKATAEFTKQYVEQGKNPDNDWDRSQYRHEYCQQLAQQLNVTDQWKELNSSKSMYEYYTLEPAKTNEQGHSFPPQIAHYVDVTEYGTPYFSPSGSTDITQEQYDKLSIIQQDGSAIEHAINPGTYSILKERTIPKGDYEMIQNKHGEPYIHGKPNFEGAPKDVYFKPTYGTHQFSDQEVKSLLKGEELSIPMRSGEGTVKLGEGKVGGHDYFGVQRTDLTKERPLPNVPTEQTPSQEMQNDKT